MEQYTIVWNQQELAPCGIIYQLPQTTFVTKAKYDKWSQILKSYTISRKDVICIYPGHINPVDDWWKI